MNHRPQIFKHRPATVEAWQWDGSQESGLVICDWVEDNGGYASLHPRYNRIVLGKDVAPVEPGDWIVRDKFNEFWPLADSIFPAVYESLLAGQ